jgi:hypothetical protein
MGHSHSSSCGMAAGMVAGGESGERAGPHMVFRADVPATNWDTLALTSKGCADLHGQHTENNQYPHAPERARLHKIHRRQE